ncbi:MAG: cytochrome-c oxidase [Robiginitomaculum sp.]|nr:MAG: cytochrome-c oxidase [Robiginitomaculum sp.]
MLANSSIDNAASQAKTMFGEELIWLFIFGDLCTFTLFFFIFGHARTNNSVLYHASQAKLNVHFGSINTLLLLSSSWFVVRAASAARKGLIQKCTRALAGAFILGAGFAVFKIIEYIDKANAGISFSTNDFFLFYYLLTGLHFIHLLTGLSLIAYFIYNFRANGITRQNHATFESGAIFWHMVDLLWIVIFPLLYLLP